MKNLTPQYRVIVALDYPTEPDAMALVERLGEAVRFYKIGLQLFTAAGPGIVKRVKETGARVFLDLKFHDIPNTVQHSVASACALGVDFLTIHLAGGAAMIRAAAAGAAGTEATVLGVTVLTSSTVETLREVAIESSIGDQVARLAQLAFDNGVSGLIASPLEVVMLRETFQSHFTIVTPGVRPDWADANDQKRTLTPLEAVRAGADFLVIGRPITAHPDPVEAARRIAAELAER